MIQSFASGEIFLVQSKNITQECLLMKYNRVGIGLVESLGDLSALKLGHSLGSTL